MGWLIIVLAFVTLIAACILGLFLGIRDMIRQDRLDRFEGEECDD